ncbi:MAG TPA: ABC transporter permease, partial [Candidatus Limnocylindrales bacterium]|nr:ABC transporter permease [Candidatus Limnocylindrales bacterium]
MNLARAIVIARANLTRLFRDRLGLFFIVVLPLIIILVLGLQFGSGFNPRLAVAATQPGVLGEELIETLDADLTVTRLDGADAVRDAVERGRAELGLLLPDNYEQRLQTGESVEVELIGAPNNVAIGLQRLVSGAVASQSALFRAARFAASETGTAPAQALETARGISAALPPIEVEVSAAGERLFPESLTGFALGAQSQLVLFVFLTSLNGAAQLILSRQLGVSRRMLSTPTRMSTILVGEGLGRFAVA